MNVFFSHLSPTITGRLILKQLDILLTIIIQPHILTQLNGAPLFKSEVFTVVKCTVVCVYPECFLFLLPQTLASHLWPFLCVFASLETDRIRNRKVKVTQQCQTLCNPMNYTVHGILQARILEWVAFPFSRGSSQLRDRIQVSHIAGRFFTS